MTTRRNRPPHVSSGSGMTLRTHLLRATVATGTVAVTPTSQSLPAVPGGGASGGGGINVETSGLDEVSCDTLRALVYGRNDAWTEDDGLLAISTRLLAEDRVAVDAARSAPFRSCRPST